MFTICTHCKHTDKDYNVMIAVSGPKYFIDLSAQHLLTYLARNYPLLLHTLSRCISRHIITSVSRLSLDPSAHIPNKYASTANQVGVTLTLNVFFPPPP